MIATYHHLYKKQLVKFLTKPNAYRLQQIGCMKICKIKFIVYLLKPIFHYAD